MAIDGCAVGVADHLATLTGLLTMAVHGGNVSPTWEPTRPLEHIYFFVERVAHRDVELPYRTAAWWLDPWVVIEEG